MADATPVKKMSLLEINWTSLTLSETQQSSKSKSKEIKLIIKSFGMLVLHFIIKSDIYFAL